MPQTPQQENSPRERRSIAPFLKTWKSGLAALLLLLISGLLLPESLVIPVLGATRNDWNQNSFWYEPWGASGVHKGIDIFGLRHTPVIAPSYGLVVYTGNISLGGNVVAILGPGWKVHYLAHLETVTVETFSLLQQGQQLGSLGDSGNAKGKQPHVHYSIVSLLPYPWRFSTDSQGWKKMFYLNPQQEFTDNP